MNQAFSKKVETGFSQKNAINQRDVILDIRGLVVKSPTGSVLVDHIDVQLRAGEVLGLIGESGAGKSTIGLAAMGYGRGGCSIASGEIKIDETSLMGGDRADREKMRGCRIAYVAQSAAAAFNPAWRLGQQIIEAPLYHGLMSKQEAQSWMLELLHALQLPEPEAFAQKFPHQISGGQLQRAMIAMAMAGRPDILVLDEPTTALDVTTQIEVLALLRQVIHKYNTAALYITHDLAVVAQVADNILVLRQGKFVEHGRVDTILENPTQDYTKRLVAERRGEGLRRHQTIEQPQQKLFEVTKANAFYGKIQVLHDVSVHICRGETVAIVGESGSGKSTLARLSVGLMPSSQAEIFLEDERLNNNYKKRACEQLRRIQLIHQSPDVALNPRQKIGDIIGRPCEFYFNLSGEERENRVRQLLNQVSLDESFANRLPGALSGGQKQRVSIARALAAKPDLIICDEVTSALDPLIAEETLQLLKKLQDETGVAYLFITHDLGVVRRIADRTIVMQNGRIIEADVTEKIFQPPYLPYTGQLITSVPQLRCDWLDEVLQQRIVSACETP